MRTQSSTPTDSARATDAFEHTTASNSSSRKTRNPRAIDTVRAVIVSHEGAAFLRRTLAAISDQSRAVDELVGVDVASADDSASMLRGSNAQTLVADRRTSYAQAISVGVNVEFSGEVNDLMVIADAVKGTAAAAASGTDTASGADATAGAKPAATGPESGDEVIDLTDAAADEDLPDVTTVLPRMEPSGPAQRWIWLIHDDGAPAPDALKRLLESAETAPSAGILGCKQIDARDATQLLEVGQSISALGKPIYGHDVEDLDQGQLDDRRDVYAVSTSGMLIREDVWHELGGFSRDLSHARAGQEFCRRAHLAGYRVVVVPQAKVSHACATERALRGRRSRNSWHRLDRRDALLLRFAQVPAPTLPFVWLWSLAALFVRSLGWMMLKQPRLVWDEIIALLQASWRWGAQWRLRSRARQQRRVPRRTLKSLRAPWRWVLRSHRDALTVYARAQERAWVLAAERAVRAEQRSEARKRSRAEARAAAKAARQASKQAVHESVDEDTLADLPPGEHAIGTADPDAILLPRSRREVQGLSPQSALGLTDTAIATKIAQAHAKTEILRRRSATLWAFSVVSVFAVSLMGMMRLVQGSGVLLSSNLPPAGSSFGELWELSTSWWRPIGLGHVAAPDQLALVMALLSAPLGSPQNVPLLIWLAANALAFTSAWTATGVLASSVSLRLWVSVVWAFAPTFLMALNSGRLGAVIAHIVLPWFALALAKTVGVPTPGWQEEDSAIDLGKRPSPSAAAATGLLAALLMAAAPMLTLVVVVSLLTAMALARSGRLLLLWSATITSVVLYPQVIATLSDPSLLWAEALRNTGSLSSGDPRWFVLGLPDAPATLLPSVPWLSPAMASAQTLAESLSISLPILLNMIVLAVCAPVAILAILAVLRPGARGKIAMAALIQGMSAAGIAFVAATYWVAGVQGQRPWIGPLLSWVLAAILVAWLLRVDGAATRLRRLPMGLAQLRAMILGLMLIALPTGLMAGWALNGNAPGDEPATVRLGPLRTVPAVSAAESQSPAQTRTLVLNTEGTVLKWNLLRSPATVLGQESAALSASLAHNPEPSASDGTVVMPVLSALLTGSNADARAGLAALGVQTVVMSPPVKADVAAALDSATGLVPSGSVGDSRVWRVNYSGEAGAPALVARVRLQSAEGVALSVIPAVGQTWQANLAEGEPGRLIVLDERADARWKASIKGQPLTARTWDGWAQAFEVPNSGGPVIVRQDTAANTWLERSAETGRAVVALTAVLLALPLPSRRRRVMSRLARGRLHDSGGRP